MWWMWMWMCLAVADASDRVRPSDAAALTAEAWEPPPADRLWYTNATFLRVNPLGLIEVHRLGWRHRLSTKDSLLMRDTYTFLGGSAVVTPAWARLGVYGEIQPLAVLRLFAEANGVGYFGSFDQVLSWPDPAARYSDRTIAALGDQGENAPRSGWVVTLGGTVRGKVGPIAARSTFQATRIDLGLPEGDAFFYDQYWDRLAPDGGWMFLNDLDVLAMAGSARIGARHTWSDTPGADRATDGGMAHHRVGPLFAYELYEREGASFSRPTVFVMAQWWLAHPYRTGAEQPQGLPLVAAGFAFEGDLIRWKR